MFGDFLVFRALEFSGSRVLGVWGLGALGFLGFRGFRV